MPSSIGAERFVWQSQGAIAAGAFRKAGLGQAWFEWTSLRYHACWRGALFVMPKSSGVAKILQSQVIYEGRAFGVRRDEVREPGGVRTIREVVTHPGSVVILPVLADGRIVMVRQYRHATRGYLWELVAGRMDPGESVRVAAARELAEETGYRAKRLRVFLDVFPTPGFVEERMYILLAQGLEAGAARPEDDEKISVKAFQPRELEKMIRDGQLHDAKSVAGILYYLHFLR